MHTQHEHSRKDAAKKRATLVTPSGARRRAGGKVSGTKGPRRARDRREESQRDERVEKVNIISSKRLKERGKVLGGEDEKVP